MLIRDIQAKDALALSELLSPLDYSTSDSVSLEKISDYSKEGYKLFVAEFE
ncbi:MAG: hypothetical protein JJE09_08080 [Bacteroidia bacterium]|nr:hypothetical protein [Bacteroidia bacterium]